MAELAQIKMLRDVTVEPPGGVCAGVYTEGRIYHIPEWLARDWGKREWCTVISMPRPVAPPVPELRPQPTPPQQTAPQSAVEAKRVRRDPEKPKEEDND